MTNAGMVKMAPAATDSPTVRRPGSTAANGRLMFWSVTPTTGGAWFRSVLITDPTVQRVVDATLANDALRYGPLSQPKTARAIDAIIERYDSRIAMTALCDCSAARISRGHT